VTATLEMRGRGLLICPARSQVITPAPAPLGPVPLSRPVPPPVHLVPGLVRAVLPVLPLLPVLLPVLLAQPLGLARRGRGSGRVGWRM
jgi:hypothetical protein